MINKLLEWFKSLFWKEEMELTLVGLQHAGKTTFVNVIASGNYNEDMIPTVGFNMRKITKGNVTIKLWDIGGQPRFRSMWERYCRYFQTEIQPECQVYKSPSSSRFNRQVSTKMANFQVQTYSV